MRKRMVITVTLALFLLGIATLPWAPAQETGKEAATQLKLADSYKVEFAVDEIENGKKINSRSYMLMLRAETSSKWTERQYLRVGSRVPYAAEADKFQYQDVGMNIDCRLMPMENGNVAVDTNLQYMSVGGEQGDSHDKQHPVFRQVRSAVDAVVPLDKPTVLTEMDDVASTHRYVFEVKVTKVTP